MTAGGAREGAGRPNLGRSRRVIYATELEYLQLKLVLSQMRYESDMRGKGDRR